jgi:tRNA 2-thiouridine synthesizing protein A
MRTLDVTGLSCPEPVIRTLAALKSLGDGEAVTILADTVTTRENIRRSVEGLGLSITVAEDGKLFRLTVEKP